MVRRNVTQQPPSLARTAPTGPFDPARVVQRQRRAASTLASADYLHRRAAGDLAERLAGINRTFGVGVDLGGRSATLVAAIQGTPGAAGKVGWWGDLVGDHAAVTPGATSAVVPPETVPLAPESVDLVTSVLALHTVNDLPGLFVQVRRALRPDGLFLAAMFGPRTLSELRGVLVEAEAALTGGAGARVAPFADVQDLARLLQRAGFALPVADTELVRVRFATPLALLADLRAMGETSVLAGPHRPLRRDVLAQAMGLYAARHSGADGRVDATFEMVTVTGWAPAPGQQKPLAPGSARMRLADALGVTEHRAGDQPRAKD